MVRRGSTVRVRQRASNKNLQTGPFIFEALHEVSRREVGSASRRPLHPRTAGAGARPRSRRPARGLRVLSRSAPRDFAQDGVQRLLRERRQNDVGLGKACGARYIVRDGAEVLGGLAKRSDRGQRLIVQQSVAAKESALVEAGKSVQIAPLPA
jgi:hypothetical protein